MICCKDPVVGWIELLGLIVALRPECVGGHVGGLRGSSHIDAYAHLEALGTTLGDLGADFLGS